MKNSIRYLYNSLLIFVVSVMMLGSISIILPANAETLTEADRQIDERRFSIIDAKNPISEYQIRRRNNTDLSGDNGGVCNVSAITTLLNRRLAADYISGSFSVRDVLQSLNCGNIITDGVIYSNKNFGTSGTKCYQYWYYTGGTGNWCVSGTNYYNGNTNYSVSQISGSAIKNATSKNGFYEYIAGLLHQHPEGIAIRNTAGNHVVVIYKYTFSNGSYQLYVKDPVYNYSGSLEGSYMWSACGYDLYTNIDFIVYINGNAKVIDPYQIYFTVDTENNGFYRAVSGSGAIKEYPYSGSKTIRTLSLNVDISDLTSDDVIEVVEFVANSYEADDPGNHVFAHLSDGTFIYSGFIEKLYYKIKDVNMSALCVQQDIKNYPFWDASNKRLLTQHEQVKLIAQYKNNRGKIWYEVEGGGFINEDNLRNLQTNVTIDISINNAVPNTGLPKTGGEGIPTGSLVKGNNFGLRGIITASENILSVEARVINSITGQDALTKVSVQPNSASLDIRYSNINNLLAFEQLTDGVYEYRVTATTVSGAIKTLISSTFAVGAGALGDIPEVPTGVTIECYDTPFYDEVHRYILEDYAKVPLGGWAYPGNYEVAWESSNPAVATAPSLSNAYKMEIVGVGTAVIKCYCVAYPEVYAKFTVEVTSSAITPTPTNEKISIVIENASPSSGLPKTSGTGVPYPHMPEYRSFGLRGVITAFENIASVTATIYNITGQYVDANLSVYPNSTTLDIQYSDINNVLRFNVFNPGTYRYTVVVTTVSGYTETVIDAAYSIGDHDPCAHQYEWETIQLPTCSVPGLRQKVCGLCGHPDEREEIEMIAHTPGEWLITTEPTTTRDGLRERFCTVCGAAIESEVIPLTFTPVFSIDPIFEDGQVIHPDSTGAFQAKVYPENATNKVVKWFSTNPGVLEVEEDGAYCAIATGKTTVYCCADDEYGVVSPYVEITVDHFFSWVIVKQPTAIKKGQKDYVCSLCNLKQKTEEIPSLTSALMEHPDILTPAGLSIIEAESFAGIPATLIKLSENVSIIGDQAFANCSYLKQIYIPRSVVSISDTAFNNVPNTAFSIVGYKNTEAQFYASRNNISFISLDPEPQLSGWVLMTDVPENAEIIQTKTQYSFRDKNVASYSDWSSWSAWSYDEQSIADSNLKQEETALKWRWWAAKCSSCGHNNPYHASNCKTCGTYLASNQEGTTWISVFAFSDDTSGTQTIHGRSGGRYFDGEPYWNENKQVVAYRYRTRELLLDWGAWSVWTDTPVEPTVTREVNTRTMAQYLIE